MRRWIFARWNASDGRKPYRRQKAFHMTVNPSGFLDHAPVDPRLATLPGRSPKGRLNLDGPCGYPRWWVNLHDPDGPRYRVVGYLLDSSSTVTLVGRTDLGSIAAHACSA